MGRGEKGKGEREEGKGWKVVVVWRRETSNDGLYGFELVALSEAIETGTIRERA